MTTSEQTTRPLTVDEIGATVADALATTPFIDIHTHLFGPEFGTLGLWGIDELLTYHYLEAELIRCASLRPREYWALATPARADLIWRTLFVERAPVSEATCGVVAVLDALGLDARSPSLAPMRDFFGRQDLADHWRRVLQLAGISDVVMTNDPLDPDEAARWTSGVTPAAGSHAVLRLDRILNDLGARATPAEVRHFLADWVTQMRPLYMAVSLPDSFAFPADDTLTTLLRAAVLPACREFDLPLSLMIGVRRQVNPALRLAGDGSGRADLRALEALCQECPDNRFLVSVLSRENQHELCVYARKFSNLLPFGCWWFLNNSSIVAEMTTMRLEMLGTTFIPQHSDARVLEQLIYKWRNTRQTIAPVLATAYRKLAAAGRPVSRDDIRDDVGRLFRGNFERWTKPMPIRA